MTADWLWRSIAPPSSSSKQVAEFNGRRRRHFWFATLSFTRIPSSPTDHWEAGQIQHVARYLGPTRDPTILTGPLLL